MPAQQYTPIATRDANTTSKVNGSGQANASASAPLPSEAGFTIGSLNASSSASAGGKKKKKNATGSSTSAGYCVADQDGRLQDVQFERSTPASLSKMQVKLPVTAGNLRKDLQKKFRRRMQGIDIYTNEDVVHGTQGSQSASTKEI